MSPRAWPLPRLLPPLPSPLTLTPPRCCTPPQPHSKTVTLLCWALLRYRSARHSTTTVYCSTTTTIFIQYPAGSRRVYTVESIPRAKPFLNHNKTHYFCFVLKKMSFYSVTLSTFVWYLFWFKLTSTTTTRSSSFPLTYIKIGSLLFNFLFQLFNLICISQLMVWYLFFLCWFLLFSVCALVCLFMWLYRRVQTSLAQRDTPLQGMCHITTLNVGPNLLPCSCPRPYQVNVCRSISLKWYGGSCTTTLLKPFQNLPICKHPKVRTKGKG